MDRSGASAGAQLVVLPEQAITGYPAEDLWLKPHFLDASRRALEGLASHAREIVALVGFPERDAATFNSLAVLAEAGFRAPTGRRCYPTTACSTSAVISSPGTRPR